MEGGENMNNKQIIITLVVAIIVGAAAFFGGMQYQKFQRNVFFTTNGGEGGRFGGARFGQGGRGGFTPVIGQITESDDKTMTVKMQDGSSKIVVLSGTSSINKSSAGTKSDLKAGETVAVFGSTNSDGSVTAQSIQLNPQMRMQRPTGTQSH